MGNPDRYAAAWDSGPWRPRLLVVWRDLSEDTRAAFRAWLDEQDKATLMRERKRLGDEYRSIFGMGYEQLSPPELRAKWDGADDNGKRDLFFAATRLATVMHNLMRDVQNALPAREAAAERRGAERMREMAAKRCLRLAEVKPANVGAADALQFAASIVLALPLDAEGGCGGSGKVTPAGTDDSRGESGGGR